MELPPDITLADIGTDNPKAGFYQFFPAPANGTSAFPFAEAPGAELERGVEYLWNAVIRKR